MRGSVDRGGRWGYYSPEGFRDVVLKVWLSPRKFFRRLDPEGAYVWPALFATAVLYLNLLLEELLQDAWLLEFNYGLYVATVAVKETLFISWRRAATAALLPLGAVLLIILLLTGPTEAYRLLI